jgi:hypothetical protein
MVVNPAIQSWQLEEIRIHLDGAGTAGNLTVTEDSGVGATYDTQLLVVDMTAIVNMVWIPQRPIRLTGMDHVDLNWPNVNNCDYGIQVFYSPI